MKKTYLFLLPLLALVVVGCTHNTPIDQDGGNTDMTQETIHNTGQQVSNQISNNDIAYVDESLDKDQQFIVKNPTYTIALSDVDKWYTFRSLPHNYSFLMPGKTKITYDDPDDLRVATHIIESQELFSEPNKFFFELKRLGEQESCPELINGVSSTFGLMQGQRGELANNEYDNTYAQGACITVDDETFFARVVENSQEKIYSSMILDSLQFN